MVEDDPEDQPTAGGSSQLPAAARPRIGEDTIIGQVLLKSAAREELEIKMIHCGASDPSRSTVPFDDNRS